MRKKYPNLSPQAFLDNLQKDVHQLDQICFAGVLTKHGTMTFILAPNQNPRDLIEFRKMLTGSINDLEKEEDLCQKKQKPAKKPRAKVRSPSRSKVRSR